jgi:hypothetical protein
MPNESKKPICPNCGSEAHCFRRERYEWVSRLVDYTLFCPKCGCRETETKHGGYTFFIWGIHLPTTCPFCGKPSNEHVKDGDLDELKAGLHSSREEVSPALDPKADVCPKCGKGEVICSYLGDTGAVDCYFTWLHECTNPECDYHEEFTEFHCTGQDTAAEAEAGDQRGPGKAGGCAGPHK